MTQSIWLSFSDSTNFPKLTEDISVDVVIVGGGITGVMTAQLLSREGLKVAVLERDRVGVSSTGHSTGNLYGTYQDLLKQALKKFDENVVNQIIKSRNEAVDLIERNIQKFSIDCDFHRTSWNYYSVSEEFNKKIEKGLEGARQLKVKATESDLPELPFRVSKGLKIEGAAQFNPLRYVQGLAKAIHKDNCQIFEQTEVTSINTLGTEITVTTQEGRKVKATYIVHATHSPKGIFRLHGQMESLREFGIACRIRGEFPEGVYFGYFEKPETRSIRTYERNGEKYLIVVSEHMKVGEGDTKEKIRALEDFARKHFDVQEVTHQWGGQHYKPADSVPYIGRNTPGSNTFVATAFSTHGLIYGTVGAQLISDIIAARDNEYEEIYRPYRFTPLKSAKEVIKENLSVGKELIKDYLLKSRDKTFDEVAPGEGKIIKQEGHQLAVFRGEDNHLEVCSAICTHMGCVVHWNNGEKSWDCPCHGSRFSTSGAVLEGPALKALANMNDLLQGKVQQHVLSDDEMVDQAGRESFPASDPPGYSSKTLVDKEQHRHE